MDLKAEVFRIVTNIRTKSIAEFGHAPVGTTVAVLVCIDLIAKYIFEDIDGAPTVQAENAEYTTNLLWYYLTVIGVYSLQIGVSMLWVRLYLIYRHSNTGLCVLLLFVSCITAAFMTIEGSAYYALRTTEPRQLVHIGLYSNPVYLIFVVMSVYLVFENDGIKTSAFPWYKNAAYLIIAWIVFHGTVTSLQGQFEQYFNYRYTHAITAK